MINVKNRTIFCNDNLNILQGINSNSIDLIYIDPPFNKKKEFNAPIGSSSEGASFKDWFREEDVKDDWIQTIKEDNIGLYNFLNGVKNLSSITSIKNNKHYLYNYCYLSYMAIRLIELYRILKDTGSFYLHCDNTMGHYLKILLDIIFGEKNFKNSIVWNYQAGTSPKNSFKRNYDVILFYSISKNTFNRQSKPVVNSKRYNKRDEDGRLYDVNGQGRKYYLDNGQTCDDVWSYLQEKEYQQINSQSKERTGYPTQKPLALLERIIKASSKEGDIVLDAFCGCATTCVASEKFNRQWIGIDVSFKAYDLVRERLNKEVKEGESALFNWNEKIIFKTNPPKRTDDNNHDTRLKKYIYIISHPNYKGFYKVGIAKNYKARLNSYQTSDPLREYKLEYKKLTHLFREIEKHIHNTFDNLLEWVQANKDDIIKEIENY